MNWKTTEDNWNRHYAWFLVDEGEIQYSFRSKSEAEKFRDHAKLSYMLLTDLQNITHDTMLDPSKYYCWSGKIQRCVISI